MPVGEIRIRGAAEVEKAFLDVRREVLAEIRPALRGIAKGVARDAENKAEANISHIGAKWSRMRIGVTVKTVYVAPKQRRHGGSPRKNLAPLLMNKAMQPALDENQDEIVRRLGEVVEVSAARHGFL